MALTNSDKIITIFSNVIAVFFLLQDMEELPKNTTIYDFCLKVIPADIKSELSVELIDDVFKYVTSAHSSSNVQ